MPGVRPKLLPRVRFGAPVPPAVRDLSGDGGPRRQSETAPAAAACARGHGARRPAAGVGCAVRRRRVAADSGGAGGTNVMAEPLGKGPGAIQILEEAAQLLR